MKRLGIFIAAFLIVAVILFFLGKHFFPKGVESTGEGSLEIVKRFSFEPGTGLDGWEKKLLGGKKTKYSLDEYEGVDCVKASSHDSASALYYRQRLSSEKGPFLSWDWKAEKFPELKYPETLEEKDEFDFAAQVYIIFHARFFLNMKAIQYVWTKEIPVGTVSASPYTKNVMLMVLESGVSDGWKHEMRDLRADYKALFGEDLGSDVEAVAFMADSDSTDSSSEAYFGNISIGYMGNGGGAPAGSSDGRPGIRIPRLPRMPFFRGRSQEEEKGMEEKQEDQPSNT